VLVFGDEASQNRFAGANLRQRSCDWSRLDLRGPEYRVRFIGLKEDRGAGVVTNHLLAFFEHQLESLVHRLAGRFLDELVHERVTG